MGEAIGGLLPFAIGVAISPMPIVAIVLMLITPKAGSNGSAFLMGWVAGVAVAGAVSLAILGPLGAGGDDGAPAGWTVWLELVLGLGLLFLAVRQWQRRPGPGADVATPKWMSALDGFTPVKAAGLAIVLSALNPKNLLFVVGGATAVAQQDLRVGQSVVAGAVFTVIAAVGVAVPMGIYLFLGDRAAATLDKLKTWMATNNTAVTAVLLLIIGIKLIGDGIAGIF